MIALIGILAPQFLGSLALSLMWFFYIRSERRRWRSIVARHGVHISGDEEPEGPPLCVACGADVQEFILWSYGPPGEAPKLMRSLNLCEECGYRVAQEIA